MSMPAFGAAQCRCAVNGAGMAASLRVLDLQPCCSAALCRRRGALDVAAVDAGCCAGFHLQSAAAEAAAPEAGQDDGQMLVQAAEVDYDYNNSRVSAVGNVQMFYNGTSVEADKVIYDQKTKRLHAEGNIRMTDADGKITYAKIMDL